MEIEEDFCKIKHIKVSFILIFDQNIKIDYQLILYHQVSGFMAEAGTLI